ncbi:hypothetical protein SCHPADRAFT_926469 [Schizopora paradoxa]|uniref:MYND-type domain-containing protein n=1 Tax=Schizopora paradoxa TaxID=27342 RepID=A0A0H2RXY9_9AGAM|nr:hypothetical protein SCHPADRAFT_926469 [Schizopora paradoxa]
MLKKKAIPFLTQTFVKLANVNTIHEDTKNIDFVDKLLRVFEYVLQPDGGVPYLLQALRNGFLQGVVNCGPLLSLLRPDAVNALKHIIDHFLISYLSYYSVLLAIIDALKDVDRKCLEQNVDQSALKPSWMKFEQYVLERSVCKALFERCIQSDTSVSSCAQCGKRDVKNNFQKCGGCRIMHYCSKDCQTTHWKEGGHRAICKRILETGGGWDRRDRRFSEFITVYDISRHAADLHQMALKKYGVQPVPLGKTLPYGSSVDYGTVPPTFDVIKLEDDVGENETSYLNSKKDDWDEGVKTRGSGGFLAKFILPRGASDLGQMFLADTGLIGMHLWQRNSDDLTLAFGPRFRWTGIDSDGKSLGAVSDEIDGVLNKLPLAKVRMGDHFLWSSYMGRMSVLEAISELADIEKKIYGI